MPDLPPTSLLSVKRLTLRSISVHIFHPIPPPGKFFIRYPCSSVFCISGSVQLLSIQILGIAFSLLLCCRPVIGKQSWITRHRMSVKMIASKDNSLVFSKNDDNKTIDNFYKSKNNYCICDRITQIANENQLADRIGVKVTKISDKRVVVSDKTRPGIQCQKCYLMKRVKSLPKQSEIACHRRTRWESTRIRVRMYRTHIKRFFADSLAPVVLMPECWSLTAGCLYLCFVLKISS